MVSTPPSERFYTSHLVQSRWHVITPLFITKDCSGPLTMALLETKYGGHKIYCNSNFVVYTYCCYCTIQILTENIYVARNDYLLEKNRTNSPKRGAKGF